MQNNIKSIDTWSINVYWDGGWRHSPEYATKEEAISKLLPFLKKLRGKYLKVTIQRSTRYVASDEGAA